MKAVFASLTVLIVTAVLTRGQSTAAMSNAEIQGQGLVQSILERAPAENYTNIGVLKIRGGGGARNELKVECLTLVTPANWQTIYEAYGTEGTEVLRVVHAANQPNRYFIGTYPVRAEGGEIPVTEQLISGGSPISSEEVMSPFAGSDFWRSDLGLEFLHWPGQKVLKRETHRSRGCTVLESTRPDLHSQGYSKVVSWVDNESMGIVEAYAYDGSGNKLKDFYPKDFEKVAGQWQVRTLVMEDVQKGSRSRLDFDLKK